MKCTKILSVFVLFMFSLSCVFTIQTERTMKRLKFRKWFSRRLFEKAKDDFDRATKKVDQAKEMILLAKTLVAHDKQDAEEEGQKINNVNDFVQLVISKTGPIKDLSSFSQFVVGYLVGDFMPKIKKSFAKEEALAVVNCI